VPLNSSLNDIVLFEVPSESGASLLRAELSSTRLAWLEDGDDLSVVGALLNPNDDDLACLLRTVEKWIEQHGLLAIRFEVDGATYVLQPALAATADTAA
jgi:hypothetical protein